MRSLNALASVITLTSIAAMASTTPLSAQSMAGMKHDDPTNAVNGSGVMPAGWKLRFDPLPQRAGAPARPVPTIKDVKFTPSESGFDITSGPAAIYYNPNDIGKGGFLYTATFSQQKSMQHEAYGIFIGGSDLETANQNYLYFVVRPSDGMAMISHRSGDAAPKTLVPYFANAAINKDDPKDGHATNMLAIHIAPDSLHFVANGQVIAAVAKVDLDGAKTDGQVGIRVNHNMDLKVSKVTLRNP